MIAGKRVVVTGKIAGESRQTAEAKLRDAGAIVQSTVTGETDVLVTGAKVGAVKIGKATASGVAIVPWERAFAPAPGATANGGARPLVPKAAARTVAPMLAKAGELPSGEGWLFEVKWDGYRGIATVKGGEVALQSRSGKSDLTEQFPEIVAELSVLPDCVIDGELAVLDDEGNSSFESMDAKAGASYVVFDVLEVAGHDVRGRPLDERRKLLEELLKASGDRICVSPAFDDGEALLAWAAAQKVEGIVAKRRTSTYREGSRTEAWLKIKLRCEQEFAVVGWKPGEGAMAGAAGSLLLAVFDGAEFAYVGRVGTGCSYDLWQSFTELPQRGSPVPIDLGDAPAAELRDVVWVEPELVVQVRFQRWTVDGRLWHPSVVGVRTDKSPTECRRES